ncbi:MAG: AmmeMemoRadiSam system protein B [Planctomycetes bacterium]|nr:AmmeMemoRadiSam system protein B [Planctomycetota bacterium]
MNRDAVVAGSFYPGRQSALEKDLKKMTKPVENKSDALGVVSPHAGYMYSGWVAGEVFSSINIPDRVVILAPNHTGQGKTFALWPGGQWTTPLGAVEIDPDLCAAIKRSSSLIEDDTGAHKGEHSAEVQVPFLQYFQPDLRMAVVVIGSNSLPELKQFGRELGEALKSYGRKTLIVASSDMTHYESQASAQQKDKRAINKILDLDEDGLMEIVKKYDVSMCGVGPTVAMLTAAKVMGAQKSRLIRYQTSGETSGDFNQVVGYAGIVVI